jgi:hypothetical protein
MKQFFAPLLIVLTPIGVLATIHGGQNYQRHQLEQTRQHDRDTCDALAEIAALKHVYVITTQEVQRCEDRYQKKWGSTR